MKFVYNENSGLFPSSKGLTGFRGFGINVNKIRNLNAARRLEELVKESKVSN